jgi:TolB protein
MRKLWAPNWLSRRQNANPTRDQSRHALMAWLAAALMSAGAAHAQLNVEITGVGSNQFPVATANFQGEAQAPQNLTAIIRSDLTNSGRFRNIDPQVPPWPNRPRWTWAAGRRRAPTRSWPAA